MSLLITLAFSLITAPLMSASDNTSSCQTLFDFGADGVVDQWRSVNDNVMGGRSEGGAESIDGMLRFGGAINTNGGGFASIRARLKPNALSDANVLRLRMLPDDRTYQVSIQTDVSYWGRPVAYRADIRTLAANAWSEPTVFFSELKPTVFGRRVQVRPFEPAAARTLSIFIADGIDGEFDLALERIDVCRL